ncbi:MAG: hypothetical protein NC087_04955, partial [Anaeroplasma bactoclasticum]|nr:hypothetical protein [Anaeroplasma bactoclasticum]
MNLIAFLRNLVLKIKENHYTKSETDELVNEKIKSQIPSSIDETSDVEVKNLTVGKNLSSHNLKVDNKVQSNLTPEGNATQNLGSSAKAWKNVYTKNDGLKFQTSIPNPHKSTENINFSPIAVDSQNKVILYYPPTASDTYTDHKAVQIDEGYIKVYSKSGTQVIKIDELETIINALNQVRIQGDGYTAKFGGCSIGFASEEINLIPDATSFNESSQDRIKIGGREYVTYNAEGDYAGADIILCYKPANSDSEIVPFAITKTGDMYYKGKLLESKIEETVSGKMDNLNYKAFNISAGQEWVCIGE